MKKNTGFSLTWVLITVTITSIISALTTGVIIFNNKVSNQISYADITKDEALSEFLEVYANISSEYYKDVDKNKMLEKAIAAMMDYLGDDYTDYLNDKTTADLMDQLKGKYTGIGVSINNSTKEITQVFEDSPAFKSGVLVGDIITGINEIDAKELSASEIVKMIKEQSGNFVLRINRNNEEISVTLKNEEIISPNVDYKILENTEIGYLKINSFSATLGVQVKKALENMEKDSMVSLIIDLRDNTGGFLSSAVDVASMFLEKGKIIYGLKSKDETETFKDETEEKRNYKIVILTNENTASAAEILAGALKQSYGATIVGAKTFGKGRVQQTMKLEDGGMVKYTSAYWLMPDGRCIDQIGITPDYSIQNEKILDENTTVIGIKDLQLDKAVDILKNITSE